MATNAFRLVEVGIQVFAYMAVRRVGGCMDEDKVVCFPIGCQVIADPGVQGRWYVPTSGVVVGGAIPEGIDCVIKCAIS